MSVVRVWPKTALDISRLQKSAMSWYGLAPPDLDAASTNSISVDLLITPAASEPRFRMAWTRASRSAGEAVLSYFPSLSGMPKTSLNAAQSFKAKFFSRYIQPTTRSTPDRVAWPLLAL